MAWGGEPGARRPHVHSSTCWMHWHQKALGVVRGGAAQACRVLHGCAARRRLYQLGRELVRT